MKNTTSFSVAFFILSSLLFMQGFIPSLTWADAAILKAPVAGRIPKADTLHGDVRVDDYYWLRDRDNPDVIAYLEAENSYTDTVMKNTVSLQESLYQEMLSRIKETDLTVPQRLDSFYYYSRTEEGKQYPIYCRKKGSLDAQEEVILDQNVLAEGYEYFDLGVLRISPDHELMAYSIDTTGAERFTLLIKDLTAGAHRAEKIPNTGYSVAWARDNRTLFYTVLDDAKRPYKLYRHTLGSNLSDDVLVFNEPDDAFWMYISLTKSEQFLVLDLGSHTTTEVHYMNAQSPEDTFQCMHARQDQVEYYIDHREDKFYILTNEDAINFKFMQADTAAPEKKHWKEVLPHRDSIKIEGIDVFKDHMVVYERINGLEQLFIIDMKTGERHYVDFPEPVYSFWLHDNNEFNTDVVRFTYNSLTTPRSVFDYNMTTHQRVLKKQYEVLGDYEPTDYQSERIFATAKDSTLIPISLVYRKGLAKDGTNPTYLVGYGAYGDSWDPYFSSNRLSLLDRGFIYAIAHVRGGGEMGRQWYHAGKLLKKINTFTDLISCAEHLIHHDYTSAENLVISGGSAGGLLIGAVLNMRPDLFRAAIADVPFVDLMNTMLDPTLPLTVLEYEEWGNPQDSVYYHYMKSYSPYDNVQSQDYPNMLITAGFNDTRVMYWEAAKWTARLRAMKTDENLLLLKTKMGTGHLGASGRYDYLRDIAFEYVFLFKVLGLPY